MTLGIWPSKNSNMRHGLMDSTLWGRVSKTIFQTFRDLFQEVESVKNESYQKISTNHLQHIFQMGLQNATGSWEHHLRRKGGAAHVLLSAARRHAPFLSRSEGKDGRNIPSRKNRTTNLLVVPMISNDQLHFLLIKPPFWRFQKEYQDDVKWWRDPINITWKHFARRPAQYCRSPAPCHCCRIGIWDPTSEA